MDENDIISFVVGEELMGLMNKSMPDPDTLEYYKRISNREILINENVDPYIVQYALMIMRWNREDRKSGIAVEDRVPIKVFINTSGGDLGSANMLIDAMKISETPVYTIALAKALSAGGMILVAGHPGKRYIFENTSVLIHDGSTGAMGDVGKVMDNVEAIKVSEEKVKEFFLKNTKISPQKYKKNYRVDWWIFSDEIISLGIADKIITSMDDLMI